MYAYAVLAAVSSSYPPHRGRLLMYYSPVRHSMPKHCVRLACIRHAASVHPEPGSNSPLSFSIFRQFHVFLTLLVSFFSIDVFTVQFSMSLCPLVECSSIISSIPLLCKSFFHFFHLFYFSPFPSMFFLSVFFCFLHRRQTRPINKLTKSCKS